MDLFFTVGQSTISITKIRIKLKITISRYTKQATKEVIYLLMFRNNETEYSKVIYLYHNKIGFRVTFSFQKYFSLNVFLMYSKQSLYLQILLNMIKTIENIPRPKYLDKILRFEGKGVIKVPDEKVAVSIDITLVVTLRDSMPNTQNGIKMLSLRDFLNLP